VGSNGELRVVVCARVYDVCWVVVIVLGVVLGAVVDGGGVFFFSVLAVVEAWREMICDPFEKTHLRVFWVGTGGCRNSLPPCLSFQFFCFVLFFFAILVVFVVDLCFFLLAGIVLEQPLHGFWFFFFVCFV
jgi:hypothetical protein